MIRSKGIRILRVNKVHVDISVKYHVLGCSPGHFGQQCNYNCGACLNGEPCDHVTGVCTGGCGAGWLGKHCREGRLTYTDKPIYTDKTHYDNLIVTKPSLKG